MPVTVNTRPNGTYNAVSEPLCFEFTMTGVDDGTKIRRLGYQLCDANGNPISAVESASPKEGTKFTLDFQDDVFGEVYTEVPNCLFQPRSEMKTEVMLKYWELVYDREQCTNTKENEQTLGPYPVFNTAVQFYGYMNTGSQTFVDLTYKPRIMRICKGSCDMIYIHAISQTNIQFDAFDSAGDFIDETGFDLGADSIHAIPVSTTSPGFQSDGSQIKKIEILVEGEVCYTYIFEDCCCSRSVYFQSYAGGYSLMTFDCDDNLAVSQKFTEICTYQPKSKVYSAEHRTKGGTQINKESFRQVTLTKVLTTDEVSDLRFYEDFLMSGSYFYEFEFMQGRHQIPSTALVKFVPNAGAIRYYKKEDCHRLVITGKILIPHQRPNNRI